MQSSEFRQLAMAEFDAVYRMAFHLARDPDKASDLVQETYAKALAAEGKFELRDHGVRPWLFKILHNTFFTMLQKQQRAPSAVEDLSDAPADGSPDESPAWDLASLDWEQVDERLKHAIDDLKPAYREVLLLWAVEGMKYKEIASVLDVPLGTVMSRLHRARGALSSQLVDYAAEMGIAVAE